MPTYGGDTGIGCGCLVGLVAFLIVGDWAFNGIRSLTDRSPDPIPAVSIPAFEATYQPVGWSYVGAQCVDGALSFADASAKACADHGGVVSVWSGSDGTLLSCEGKPPFGKAAQVRQIEERGRLSC